MSEGSAEIPNIPPTPEQIDLPPIQRIAEVRILNLGLAHLRPRADKLNRAIREATVKYTNLVRINPPPSMTEEDLSSYLDLVILSKNYITGTLEPMADLPNEIIDEYDSRIPNASLFTTKVIPVTTGSELFALEEMWYFISHEIRNPLTVVSGFIDLYQRKKALEKKDPENKIDPKYKEDLVRRHCVPSLNKISNQIEAIPEMLLLKYKPEEIPFGEVYDGIRNTFLNPSHKTALKDLNIRIQKEIPEEFYKLNLTYNRQLLFDQLLSTLLQNIERSFEQRPEKRPKGVNDPKEVRIRFEISPDGNYLDIHFEDTGTGIEEGILDENNKFTGKSGLGGEGRGMKMHQKLASYMQGEIIPDNIPPKTFDPDQRTGAHIILRMRLSRV